MRPFQHWQPTEVLAKPFVGGFDLGHGCCKGGGIQPCYLRLLNEADSSAWVGPVKECLKICIFQGNGASSLLVEHVRNQVYSGKYTLYVEDNLVNYSVRAAQVADSPVFSSYSAFDYDGALHLHNIGRGLSSDTYRLDSRRDPPDAALLGWLRRPSPGEWYGFGLPICSLESKYFSVRGGMIERFVYPT